MPDLGAWFLLYTLVVADVATIGVLGCCGLGFIDSDGGLCGYGFYIINSGLYRCGSVLVAIYLQEAATEGNW